MKSAPLSLAALLLGAAPLSLAALLLGAAACSSGTSPESGNGPSGGGGSPDSCICDVGVNGDKAVLKCGESACLSGYMVVCGENASVSHRGACGSSGSQPDPATGGSNSTPGASGSGAAAADAGAPSSSNPPSTGGTAPAPKEGMHVTIGAESVAFEKVTAFQNYIFAKKSDSSVFGELSFSLKRFSPGTYSCQIDLSHPGDESYVTLKASDAEYTSGDVGTSCLITVQSASCPQGTVAGTIDSMRVKSRSGEFVNVKGTFTASCLL